MCELQSKMVRCGDVTTQHTREQPQGPGGMTAGKRGWGGGRGGEGREEKRETEGSPPGAPQDRVTGAVCAKLDFAQPCTACGRGVLGRWAKEHRAQVSFQTPMWGRGSHSRG